MLYRGLHRVDRSSNLGYNQACTQPASKATLPTVTENLGE
jgi:hypothetical protein